eukprot:86118-Chlamydomonas_euryale.AAC.3
MASHGIAPRQGRQQQREGGERRRKGENEEGRGAAKQGCTPQGWPGQRPLQGPRPGQPKALQGPPSQLATHASSLLDGAPFSSVRVSQD